MKDVISVDKNAQKKMTIIVGHQNLRDKFREIMDRVAKGDEVIVIKGSKPVAKITKYEQEF
jgi:prevent-host-death family protein